MPDKTTTTLTTAPNPDRISLLALMVVLALTNAWFFSQVLAYTA